MKLLLKGLEKIRPPRDIHEWEPGELHEGKEPMTFKALPKQGIEGGHKTPPKEYREGGATKKKEYADPNNYKYPIDTEEHVRAAISYFSKPKNAGVYSKKEQSAIWSRIRGAAKKFGVSLSPESGPPSVEKGCSLAKDYGYGGSREVESMLSKPPKGLGAIGTDRPGSRLANMKRKEAVKETGRKFMTRKSMTENATSKLVLDSMLLKACSQKGVRLVPDAKMTKAEEGPPKVGGVYPKGPGQRGFMGAGAAYAKPGESFSGGKLDIGKVKQRLGKFSPSKDAEKGGEGICKDLEHMAGEYKKLAPTPPSTVRQQSRAFGWKKPAMFEGPKNKREAVAEAAKPVQGASGAVKDAPAGVFTSAPSVPPSVPKTPPLHPGQTISMQSVVKKPPQTPSMKSMSKSREAIEILKGMLSKASSNEQYPGNPANERGPVHGTPHGGEGPAQVSVSGHACPANHSQENKNVRGAAFAGREGNQNGSVHTTPHGGEGPAQTSVSGFDGPGNDDQMNKSGYDPDKHYMIWSAHPHVEGRWMAERSRGGAYFNPDHEGHALTKHPKYKVLPLGQDPNPPRAKQSFEPIHSAHDKEVSKAVSSMSVPRMPRAMAMAMDTWRSATNVLTRGNSRFAQHAGTNPLIGEIVDQLDEDSYKRATRLGPVLKACNSCGRTYTLNKSDDSCPSCSSLPLSVMAKSRGGYLVSSFIDD